MLASSAVAAVREILSPVSVPSFADLPEALTWWQTILAGVQAVGRVFLENPYLGGAFVMCVVCIIAARAMRTRRLAKHEAGIPLSNQVEVG
jgi:hypothetical protein